MKPGNSFIAAKSTRMFCALALAAAGLCLAASAANPRLDARRIIKSDPAAGKLITKVPFILQKKYDCGPASLAMVLRYWGVAADPDKIAAPFETDAVAGIFTMDLLIAASEAGMDAHWIEGSLSALRAEIGRNRPVIVFLNLGINPLPMRHFAVAVGYLAYQGKDYIVLHSGQDAFLMVPRKKFTRQWKRTGNMMMTIKPGKHGHERAESGQKPRKKPGRG